MHQSPSSGSLVHRLHSGSLLALELDQESRQAGVLELTAFMYTQQNQNRGALSFVADEFARAPYPRQPRR